MSLKNLDRIFYGIVGIAVIGISTVIFAYFYYYSPEYTTVGYQPIQNISFSHATHVGQLGIDCRYCHYTVEYSPYAGVPEAAVCMNCHKQVLAQDERILPLKMAVDKQQPIIYVKIHKLPDYVWFSHAVHSRRGIACFHCHGDVANMEKTYQAKPLDMKFCLECHKSPEKYIVPLSEITKTNFTGNSENLSEKWNVKANTDCSSCHR